MAPARVAARARELARETGNEKAGEPVVLGPLEVEATGDRRAYGFVAVDVDRKRRLASKAMNFHVWPDSISTATLIAR